MRPYVAWLPSGCTGTLIAPDRVLTAGHCIDGAGPHGYAVIVGKDGNQLLEGGHDFFGTALANGVPVRGFSVHPRFREAFPFAHRSPINAIALDDVGLILLAQPVTGIAPLKLAGPGDRADERTGETGAILGYGLTGSGPASAPSSLLSGDMSVISAAACEKAYPHAIIPSEICGQDLRHHNPLVQACGGDSGGPFIRRTSQGPVQIGVTSWGPEVKAAKCGRKRRDSDGHRRAQGGSDADVPRAGVRRQPGDALLQVGVQVQDRLDQADGQGHAGDGRTRRRLYRHRTERRRSLRCVQLARRSAHDREGGSGVDNEVALTDVLESTGARGSDIVDTLILDLLEWMGPNPRPYTEVLEAWRTSCPRLPVWEHANDRGFVRRHRAPGQRALVSVSAAGVEHLRKHRQAWTR